MVVPYFVLVTVNYCGDNNLNAKVFLEIPPINEKRKHEGTPLSYGKSKDNFLTLLILTSNPS